MAKLEDAKIEFEAIEIPEELAGMVENTIEKERIIHEHRNGKYANKEGRTLKMDENRNTAKGKNHMGRYIGTGVAAAAAVFVIGLNTSSVFAAGAAQLPVIGSVARVLTFRSYELNTSDMTVNAEIPGVTISEATVEEAAFSEEINQEIQQKCDAYVEAAKTRVEEYKAAFLETGRTEEEFADKNIVIAVDYEIKNQSENILSFVVKGTESWVSAYAINDYYNLDIDQMKYLTLEDMLGGDYITIANTSIKAQIAAQEAADSNVVYWTEAEGGFSSIDADTKFYVNAEGKPVVVFEKYEIAPGAVGMPEFVIDLSASDATSENASTQETSDANPYISFANEIKAAIDAKDQTALSELISYPAYIGVGEGVIVETKEDFMKLDAEALFSDEMVNMIDTYEFSTLEMYQAGVIVGDSRPNIIFNTTEDGTFKITGMNY